MNTLLVMKRLANTTSLLLTDVFILGQNLLPWRKRFFPDHVILDESI